MEAEKTKILIATAGFGEGHNSAAKGLNKSISDPSLCQIVDPCALAAPWLNKRMQLAYRRVTTHSPKLWKQIYVSCDRQDFSKERIPVMRRIRSTLGKIIEEKDVEALVSTYFIYPYFLERYVKKKGRRVPQYTIITDSLEVNNAWSKAPTDHWFVTDQYTQDRLINEGLESRKLHNFGFPVDPIFNELEPLDINDSLDEFSVLYFPTSKAPHIRRTARAVLRSDERASLTIVLGRNLRALYKKAMEIKSEFPGRVRLIGWTQRVPELLCSHHLVLGKAGGATVHEAIASACPIIVHSVIPGQEEGNVALLKIIGCGCYCKSEALIAKEIQSLLANHGELWREQKRRMMLHRKPNASKDISEFILSTL